MGMNSFVFWSISSYIIKNLQILVRFCKKMRKKVFATAGFDPGHLLQVAELQRRTIFANSQISNKNAKFTKA